MSFNRRWSCRSPDAALNLLLQILLVQILHKTQSKTRQKNPIVPICQRKSCAELGVRSVFLSNTPAGSVSRYCRRMVANAHTSLQFNYRECKQLFLTPALKVRLSRLKRLQAETLKRRTLPDFTGIISSYNNFNLSLFYFHLIGFSGQPAVRSNNY